jgi:anti-anti-sigma factor
VVTVAMGVAVAVQDLTVVLSVYGELDADNADQLADVLCHFIRRRGGLIIDAGALRFCGVAGIRMFCELNRYVNAARVHWVLVLGRHAERMAGTDEFVMLSTAKSVSEALDSPLLTGQARHVAAPCGRSGRVPSTKPG